ncbi:hypothetical protein FACS1894103_6260 [Campylobacterota bacterium]|nr:hypothetical protein FACS1894103_6260 [Campylobacterota bacterium]
MENTHSRFGKSDRVSGNNHPPIYDNFIGDQFNFWQAAPQPKRKDNYAQTAGIAAQEDAIERLLDVDIMDEYDQVEDMQAFAKLKMKQSLKLRLIANRYTHNQLACELRI